MDNRQKIINAIENLREREAALQQAKDVLTRAESNLCNARTEVARQIKNHVGQARSVLYDGYIYRLVAHDGVLSGNYDIEVVPSSIEVLTAPGVRGGAK